MIKNFKFQIYFLVLVSALVWLAVFSLPDGNLHLVACNVGQGDAILAIYGQIQVLTDGGPNNRVLACLSRHLPFWDRKIEVVILTHPDKDHYTGLIEVLKRYRVDYFLDNGQVSSSPEYELLKKEGRGRRTVSAGTKIRAGKIQLEILHPTLHPADGEDNAYSIISLLRFGNFKALLSGDMPAEVSDQLAVNGLREQVEYLKVPHHGSKNGITRGLLAVIRPKVAVISVGKNSYGHPAEETLKMLESYGLKIFRTDLAARAGGTGDIEIVSNGKSWQIKD